jgi:hypothetical protein
MVFQQGPEALDPFEGCRVLFGGPVGDGIQARERERETRRGGDGGAGRQTDRKEGGKERGSEGGSK